MKLILMLILIAGCSKVQAPVQVPAPDAQPVKPDAAPVVAPVTDAGPAAPDAAKVPDAIVAAPVVVPAPVK